MDLKARKLVLAALLAFNFMASPSWAWDPGRGSELVTSDSTMSIEVPGLTLEAAQIADQLKLVSYFHRMRDLKTKVEAYQGPVTLDSMQQRQDLIETKQRIIHKVLQTSLEIDAVQAEILVEKARYDHLLRIYTARRDKIQTLTNAAGFWTNGALWTVTEALAIPTYSRPRYSVSSGTIGIMAGLVPSAFSLYSLRAVSGGHYSPKENPNILSKIFNLPVTPDIEFPDSVWTYLNTVPAGGKINETRKRWLINFWLKDKDLKTFKDEESIKQVSRVTGTEGKGHTVTIDLLTSRLAMLEQLSAMIYRMKKLLLELVQKVESL